jgi:hypothetical protein
MKTTRQGAKTQGRREAPLREIESSLSDTEKELLRVCRTHPDQRLIVRPLERQTPEQRWCGTWYDCPVCHYSVLVLSAELQAQYDALAARNFEEGRQAHLARRSIKTNPWAWAIFSGYHWEKGWRSVTLRGRKKAR